jgi:hypothetical protein
MVTFGKSYRCRKADTDPAADCRSPASVTVTALDREVARAWREHLTDDDDEQLRRAVAQRWTAQPHGPDALARNTLEDELNDARAALADADQARHVRRDLDTARYAPVAAALTERINDLSQRLGALAAPEIDTTALPDPAHVEDQWNASTVHERRQLLRLALTEVR